MRIKRKRHSITLLEVMIVILLIGIVGGVLSYNLKGTLDKGKEFRTTEGMRRLKEILEIEIAQGKITASELKGPSDSEQVKTCVRNSGFISSTNLDAFLKNGWDKPYKIEVGATPDEVIITSER